jgi:outer membrane protein TolC
MKIKSKLILFSFVFTFCVNSILAQSTPIKETNIDEIEVSLPPLNVIIDSIVNRNGMVRFRRKHVEVSTGKLKSETLYWTRNFGVQGDGRYGTFDNTSLSSTGGSTGTILNNTTSQLNYGVGLYFKFPVFDFVHRKNQINLAKMEIEESKRMVQFQEDEIRQLAIRLYQDLVLKQKILKIRSEGLSNGKVNMQMVEKEFRNGLVPVSEYVRITGMASSAEADFESAKSDYILAKQILEDMAGFVFSIKPTK